MKTGNKKAILEYFIHHIKKSHHNLLCVNNQFVKPNQCNNVSAQRQIFAFPSTLIPSKKKPTSRTSIHVGRPVAQPKHISKVKCVWVHTSAYTPHTHTLTRRRRQWTLHRWCIHAQHINISMAMMKCGLNEAAKENQTIYKSGPVLWQCRIVTVQSCKCSCSLNNGQSTNVRLFSFYPRIRFSLGVFIVVFRKFVAIAVLFDCGASWIAWSFLRFHRYLLFVSEFLWPNVCLFF